MAKQQAYRVPSKKAAASGEVIDKPWPWILLALNPLFIVNGVHTIDFYIKAIWISAVLVMTFWFTRSKQREQKQMSFNVMELMWLGYMLWGVLSLLWVQSPVLTFERLVYLGYPMAAYIVGKQTYFWRSTTFWNVYAGVALLVGLIGICMWLFSGYGFIGFDWIMSAGRPSSTLSYRAYAGTYMVTTLPFLLWFMFSRHIKSAAHFTFVATSFSFTLLFLIYARARSGWMGLAASFVVMAVLTVIYQIRSQHGEEKARKLERLFYGALLGIAVLFGLAIAVVLMNKNLAVVSSFLLGVVIAVTVLISVGAIGGAVVLGWNDIKYKPALAVIILFTAIMSFQDSNEHLRNVDTNPQTIVGTGKETLSGALSTIIDILRSGSSDRVVFWQISRRMMFEKSIRGQYEGPGGMPHWVLGVGQNQWPIWVPLYSDILHSLGAEVHNDWIQAFVEGGPVGFFFWIGFTLSLIYYAWRGRRSPITVAVMGCVFAWIFSTQTDFLTARIYGALWIGGIAAIAWGEARVRPVFSFGSFRPSPAFRLAAGIFFLWLGAAYAITMWADRKIYTALVYGTPPIDQLVGTIFSLKSSGSEEDKFLLGTVPDKGFINYDYGVGKYLIFSPITDLSRAIARMDQTKSKPEVVNMVQKKISKEVLKVHPFNFSALALLTDIDVKQKNYAESIEYNKRYLEIRPTDYNMWMFLSQTQLTMGDSLNGAKSAYRAMEIAPDVLQVQQFWQTRFTSEYRDQVLKLHSTNREQR